MGIAPFLLFGEAVEKELDSTPDINEDDVKTVVEQTGVGEEAARKAIVDNDFDLAAAIMELQKK